jgi:hypothetical protein
MHVVSAQEPFYMTALDDLIAVMERCILKPAVYGQSLQVSISPAISKRTFIRLLQKALYPEHRAVFITPLLLNLARPFLPLLSTGKKSAILNLLTAANRHEAFANNHLNLINFTPKTAEELIIGLKLQSKHE